MTKPPPPADLVSADPLALVYLDPLTDAPRHLFVGGTDDQPALNRVSDEELRDHRQPHWRALRDAMGRIEKGNEDSAAVTRAWGTAEWIWNSEPLRRQRALDRERAEQAFAAALRLFERRDGMA